MSASLVGSEMCIRDRPRGSPYLERPNDKLQARMYTAPNPTPTTHRVQMSHCISSIAWQSRAVQPTLMRRSKTGRV
eukprot:4119748-Alexandrium_andersonii.AAC.2